MSLLLDCSLANAAAIASPTVGTGAGAFASPSTTFSGGHAIMTAKEDVIQFRQTDGVTANVNLARAGIREHARMGTDEPEQQSQHPRDLLRRGGHPPRTRLPEDRVGAAVREGYLDRHV